VQKALVALCVTENGYSLNDLHRRSVELLGEELKQVGFNLGRNTGVLERVLYPHYLSHSIGIGADCLLSFTALLSHKFPSFFFTSIIKIKISMSLGASTEMSRRFFYSCAVLPMAWFLRLIVFL